MGDRTERAAETFNPCGRCFSPEGCLTALIEVTRDMHVVEGRAYVQDGPVFDSAARSALGRFAVCLDKQGVRPPSHIDYTILRNQNGW